MSEQLGNRRFMLVTLGVLGSVVFVTVLVIKLLPSIFSPKVVYNKRPAAELVLPPTSPASEALTIPHAAPQDPGDTEVAPQAAASAATAPDTSVQDKAVDGGEYIAELGKAAGLNEQERSKMQPFLEMIARSQELIARVSEPERRADMTRRLQYQAVYGMKLRVAPDKRERVAEALQNGVPRLVFPNAKKPEVVTQRIPSSTG